MKTLVAAVLALGLLIPGFYPNPVMAQETTEAIAEKKVEAPDYSRVIAGGAVGWAVSGPDHDAGKTFYTYTWGGARIKKWKDGLSLFAAGQHVDIEGVKSSLGAKLMASQPIPGAEWASIIFGGGWLSRLAVDIVASDIKGLPPEVEDKPGFTFDAGVAISPTSRMVIIPMLHVLDRGDIGTDVALTLNAGLRLGS